LIGVAVDVFQWGNEVLVVEEESNFVQMQKKDKEKKHEEKNSKEKSVVSCYSRRQFPTDAGLTGVRQRFGCLTAAQPV
jgi:hypothetical protein